MHFVKVNNTWKREVGGLSICIGDGCPLNRPYYLEAYMNERQCAENCKLAQWEAAMFDPYYTDCFDPRGYAITMKVSPC